MYNKEIKVDYKTSATIYENGNLEMIFESEYFSSFSFKEVKNLFTEWLSFLETEKFDEEMMKILLQRIDRLSPDAFEKFVEAIRSKRFF